MPEDFNKLIFKFKELLKILNRSPATIKSYCSHIRAFWYGVDVSNVKKITRETIEAYIATLYDHRSVDGMAYSTETVCIKIRSIKRFFEYLEFANVIFINPTEFISEPKKEKRLPKDILTAKEASIILDQPNLGTLTGIRDRTILEVFYSTGIRIMELCGLTIYDADLKDGLLRVNKGKGSKDRVIPLGRHAVRFLGEYISKARPRLTRHNRKLRNLFIGRTGKSMNGQTVTVMIRKCARNARMKKHVTAHTFRHSFACALIRNGADITAVQKMLGHASLKTTEGYLRMVGVAVKKVHMK
ncbi:MAG: tyrosine-type recombinase/integrase, partial [Planctomycetes bacterium]|nr:tyrosine-type recombinase/integrase [Planctomycetota bacterium]